MENEKFLQIKEALETTLNAQTPVDMSIALKKLKPTNEELIEFLLNEVIDTFEYGIPAVVDTKASKVYLGFCNDMGSYISTFNLNEIKEENKAHQIISNSLTGNNFSIEDYDLTQLENYLKQLIELSTTDNLYNKESVYVIDFMPKYENDKFNMIRVISTYFDLWYVLKSLNIEII